MASYYSVSGALELDAAQLILLRLLLSENKDGNPHTESWLFHEHGGWSCFAFFGHTVNASALQSVLAQLRRIASTVSSRDGEFVDYAEGRFFAIHEGVDVPSYDWIVSGGTLREQRA